MVSPSLPLPLSGSKRRCFKNTGPCHLSLRLHGIPLHDARALDSRPTTVVVISNTAVINFGGRRAMWHDLLVRTYGKERVINVLAGSSSLLQHAAQSYDFGMFVVRGAVPKQFVEVLEQSVPRTIADVDAVFGSNQSLVGSSKSRFYKTWQAVGVGCSCRYKYDSTNSHPVFKVGEAGTTTTSWVKKQQPQSVSACLDTVLHFWNAFWHQQHVELVRCQPLLFAGGQHSLARRRQQLVACGAGCQR